MPDTSKTRVDFKRAHNHHYQKLEKQEDLLSEIKNSDHMKLSQEGLKICFKFEIFYVPGKGFKELVLTKMMREAMDAVQENKKHVGVTENTLFIRASNVPLNPRQCIR